MIRAILSHALGILMVTALSHATSSQAQTQAYPTKPIRIVVAYAPGGSTDIAARMIGDELGQAFGWRIVIDNRAGGGTIIGTETVARATPDGYTLVLRHERDGDQHRAAG